MPAPFHCRLHHPPPHLPILRSHSPPNPTKPLFTQSSHLTLSLHLLLLPFTVSASALCVNRSLPNRSTCPTDFDRRLTSFLVKISFTPTSSLSSSILRLSQPVPAPTTVGFDYIWVVPYYWNNHTIHTITHIRTRHSWRNPQIGPEYD